MRELFRDSEHLIRMAGLFVIGTTAFFVVRSMMVPADFGQYGHYRSGAIVENMEQSQAYAGQAVCAECHTEQDELRRAGAHTGVSCETCHGALASHASEPTTVPPRPESSRLCGGCHATLGARPAWFPQVDPSEHADGESCVTCHDAHQPGFDG